MSVRPSSDGIRASLLWTDVRGCTHHEAGRGQRVRRVLRPCFHLHWPRNAEIHQQCVLTRQQDIGRLHVAVHDAMGVSVLEGIGHLPGDPQCVLDSQLRLSHEPVPKALAFDVRHREPQLPRARLARIQYGDDVGMLQPRGERRLAPKTLRAK